MMKFYQTDSQSVVKEVLLLDNYRQLDGPQMQYNTKDIMIDATMNLCTVKLSRC